MTAIRSVGLLAIAWAVFGGSVSALAADAPHKPSWVDSGKDARYPGNVYFVGVGSGGGDAEAQADALGTISRQISAEVVSQTASSDSEVGGSLSSSFQKRTQVYTAKALRNVKFAERHEENGRLYVLAALRIGDYLATTDQLLSDLLGDTKKAAAEARQVGTGKDNGAKIRSALKLRELAKVLRALTRDYRGVYAGHPAAAPGAGSHEATMQAVGDLEKVAGDILGQVTFSLTTKGAGLDTLAEKTSSYLIGGGLQQVDAAAQSQIQIMLISNIKFRPSPHGSLVLAKGAFQLVMRDSVTGKTFFQKEANIEGGGGDERGAASNLADDAWIEFDKHLAKFIE